MPLPPGTSPTLIGPGARPSGPPGEKWAKHGTEHAAASLRPSLLLFPSSPDRPAVPLQPRLAYRSFDGSYVFASLTRPISAFPYCPLAV